MIKIDNMVDFYKIIGKELLEVEATVSPRGQQTKELLHKTFCLTNPSSRLAYFPGRKFNLPFAITEALMLFSSTKQVKYLGYFNQNIKQFSDDGKEMFGAYGARIAGNLNMLVEKLRRTPDTRQAVLNIYKASDGLYTVTKDIPCTMNLHFMIRNGKLDLHTYMRSNDVIWGTPYDVFMFTFLQEVIANTLEIEVGNYYHTASSMHVYERHYGLLNEMVSSSHAESYEFDATYTLRGITSVARAYTGLVDKNFNRIKAESDAIENFFYKDTTIQILVNQASFNRYKCLPAFVIRDMNKMPWGRMLLERWGV